MGESPEEEKNPYKSELTCADRWLPKSRSWQIFWVRINLAVPVVNTLILFPMWFRECICHAHDLFKNILPGYVNEWGNRHFEMGAQGTSHLPLMADAPAGCQLPPMPLTQGTCSHQDKGAWELRVSSHTPRWAFLSHRHRPQAAKLVRR